MLQATEQTHRMIAKRTARPGAPLAVMTGGILSDENEASHGMVILGWPRPVIAGHRHAHNTPIRGEKAPGKSLAGWAEILDTPNDSIILDEWRAPLACEDHDDWRGSLASDRLQVNKKFRMAGVSCFRCVSPDHVQLSSSALSI
jgi:hypothetical protein